MYGVLYCELKEVAYIDMINSTPPLFYFSCESFFLSFFFFLLLLISLYSNHVFPALHVL